MVRIELDIKKSLEENASSYFEKAKKAKKKIAGAKKALEKAREKLECLEEKKDVEIKAAEAKKEKTKRKAQWYEKFRWFRTSEGLLVIGGRDATTNEIVVKKHTVADDIVFHTDMAGSPFFIIQCENKKPSEQSLKEVADATCSFSRAWKLGLGSQKIFHVNPDQVTKEAKAGEYLTKGSFMIKGKTNYIDNKINAAVGIADDGAVMAGPVEAIKKHCRQYVELEQGSEKTSAIAKKILKKIGGDLDEIIRAMPSGGCRIKQ
ncbi:MAG: DUF814 domain-containing protein [Nanoarchaeota archaeon]|nr:DUF814 domain-containing protein [Nanoarchaeota archaeon]